MRRYRILFNASTSVVGGGMKNSALFIAQSIEMKSEEIEWSYAISAPLKELLEESKVFLPENRVYIFSKTPSRFQISRSRLKLLAQDKNFDLVYTMAGPAYVSFHQPHVMGISNAYITHAGYESIAIRIGLKSKVKKIFNSMYLMYHARRADYFFFQTEYSRQSFLNRFLLNPTNSFVVPNAFDQEMSAHIKQRSCDKISDRIKVFCPASAYPHKLIQIIPELSYRISKLYSGKVDFVITIPKNEPIWKKIKIDIIKFGQEEAVHNVGRYTYSDSINLLKESDIVFVPSILETFSASYLEAMASKRILIAADRKHARDICGDSAYYVDPSNVLRTAERFVEILNRQELWASKIENGTRQLKKYPSQKDRFELINKILLKLLKTTP